jgi:hypothetical protein
MIRPFHGPVAQRTGVISSPGPRFLGKNLPIESILE